MVKYFYSMKRYILPIFIFSLIFTSTLMAQEFAFIHIENGTGSNSVDTTWTNVGAGSAADFVEDTTSTYWSFASNILTAASNVSVEGMYALKYSLSFNAGVGVWYVGVSINGAAPVEPIFQRSISNTRKDAGNVSGILMLDVTQGQTVEFVVRSDDPAGADFTPSYAQLAIVPAKQNSVNYYGGMHISSQTTFASIGTAFAKLNNGFTAIPEMNDWTFGTNDLTAGSSAGGLYYVSYSVSFTGDGAPTSPAKYTFELVKNDISGSTNIFARRSTSDSDIGNVSAGGLVNISSGDVLHLEAKTEAANQDLIVEKATVSLYKLDDTSPATYAGMAITSDQTISIAATNTWTTIGNYTLSGASGWGMSSNVFTLNSTSSYGYYYIEYATSLSTVNTGGDDVELGVFIGDKLHPEMTVKRRLLSNTSVGAVCGVGVFQVDSPDSILTLKIRNTTSTNDLTIKKSLMGFSQIRYVYSDVPLPITLTRFDAVQDQAYVKLFWETASEIDNAAFLIYRNDELMATIEGAGHSSETRSYNLIDQHVIPGKTYTYVLADQNYEGLITKHVNIEKTVTINEGNAGKGYSIGHAYPNPFNPTSVLPVNVAVETDLLAELYDLSGKRVQVIYHGLINPGSYDLSIDGRSLNTGIYFLKVTINDEIIYQKVTLLK